VDKVIDIDQSPIGRTPRSNPATYTGVFSFIRELFSGTAEAKVRGYKAGRFSFNVKGGRCEACAGDGIIKIEMHFLPDVYVPCDVCKGKRYNRETLEVLYKGRNIAEVLALTVAEALELFVHIPRIREKLQTLCDVGLGYITLGQSATTLSGGEAQRIKLSRELSKRSTGRTLYLLDEPTTGLDPNQLAEIRSLIKQLGKEKTLIFSTHIMQEVEAICNRVLIINNGKIVADNRIEELPNLIKGESIVSVAFLEEIKAELLKKIKGVHSVKKISPNNWQLLGDSKADIRPEVFRFAVDQGLTLIEMHKEAYSVEDVFQKLTAKTT
ncbi:MAG TPA: hypothetical protein PLE32_07605, partial [Haliscomenobacter sp.]|nr:hypothetical protein [Haliscomenobacter sp.]